MELIERAPTPMYPSRCASAKPSTSSATQESSLQQPACISICHHGHQVVPVGNLLENVSYRGETMVTREKRLRIAKNKASAMNKFIGPAPRYLHTHLDFIYYACMVPYKRNGNLNENPEVLWKFVLRYLQKVKLIFLKFNLQHSRACTCSRETVPKLATQHRHYIDIFCSAWFFGYV